MGGGEVQTTKIAATDNIMRHRQRAREEDAHVLYAVPRRPLTAGPPGERAFVPSGVNGNECYRSPNVGGEVIT